MYQNENYWRITLAVLIIFFLGLAGTSIGHIITYWDISNDWIYPEILASENALGIISSILLTFHNSSKLRNLGILIFLATFFVELAGNVYYYYITIDPASEKFNALVSLTRPIFDANELTVNYNGGLRSWTAFIQGFWLPFAHVCVFAAIAILIEKKYEEVDKQNENSKGDPNENKSSTGTNNTDNDQPIIENSGNDSNEGEPSGENINNVDDDQLIVEQSKEGETVNPDNEEKTSLDEGLADYLKDEAAKEDEEINSTVKPSEKKPQAGKKKDSFLARVWQVKK